MQFEKKYDCKMITGHGILSDIKKYLIPLLSGKEAVLITNPLVKKLYGERLVHELSGQGFVVNMIEVPDGEKSKSLPVAEYIFDRLLELKINRSTTLITLGGGVIGDLGGFVAATFMRGIPLIHIPTTLLAQIDSSIGGKVAIDHFRAKNIIGSFYQPIAILADPEVLQSLPVEHLKNGIVEAIKIAIIGSASFFHWLDQNMNDILQKNREALNILVNKAIQLKRDIILQDPWEKKERHYLNLGHSIGHALETINCYDNLSHGEAVALGMLIETKIAHNREMCSEEFEEKIKQILSLLLSSLPFLNKQQLLNKYIQNIDYNQFWETLTLDKKNYRGRMTFILPEALGKVSLIDNIKQEEVQKSFEEFKKEKEWILC